MSELHSFHIPVLGVAYTIDTPIKVARFGISSVISIMDDELLELMRKFYCEKEGVEYIPIEKGEEDSRARRITAYLNLVHRIVDSQVDMLKSQTFENNNELSAYFELLPERSELKAKFRSLKTIKDEIVKRSIKLELLSCVRAGDIDVNIMAKVDKLNKDKAGELLGSEYSDALSALRGFANSNLSSSVVLSAGYNPRLFAYIENFRDFFPDESGHLKKKIILKVSDYRSALVQGKILAKKGIWISEFRIESGLNCGGHAFATEGMLLGPILEEFKLNRKDLTEELYNLCCEAQRRKDLTVFNRQPDLKITVQGGIGTSDEQKFLLDYYQLERTGWGSPFLLVPEVTNVDNFTLQQLATAKKEDYYLSYASPLGLPFNNFKKSTAELQRQGRVHKGRPGSPCYKKFLVSNTEFTGEPICTASRQYQHLKIEELKGLGLSKELYENEYNSIIEKDCLCEGLTAPVLLKDNISLPHKLKAVTICPGPNLAYFSGVISFTDMVGHIYGRKNILNELPRHHMFVNELYLYIDYLKNVTPKMNVDTKGKNYLAIFKNNLYRGIEYYRKLANQFIRPMLNELDTAEEKLKAI